MPRFIDAEMACDEVDKGDLLVGNNADFAKEIIRRTPSVDVVGVVRCKDCKYFTHEYIGGDLECICKCFEGMIVIAPDYYCSHGERKGE